MNRTIANRFFDDEIIPGEVGIEVEIEGNGLPTAIPKSKLSERYWTVTPDGSLRGEAQEYVLTHPIRRDCVVDALGQLYDKLDKAEILDSGRAGVHVHINVREMSTTQMFTFAMLYLVFEKVLVDYCGESRAGNLFCLRASDAEYLTYALTNAIRNDRLNTLSTNELRYASINFTALHKYGSLEFRAMRSPVGKEVIAKWVEILLKLKDASLTFKEPEELLLGVSGQGGYDFASNIFGELVKDLGDPDWNSEVTAGMRMIQPVVKALTHAIKNQESRKKTPNTKTIINPGPHWAAMAGWAGDEAPQAAPAAADVNIDDLIAGIGNIDRDSIMRWR